MTRAQESRGTDSGKRTPAQPLPAEHGRSGEFYGWCARDELRFLRCAECGNWQHPPRIRCTQCSSENVAWQPSATRGAVLTYTIVRVPLNPAFADVPYGLAIAETTDGVRMLAQVDKRDLDELRIGAAVEVRYRPVSESISLPYFSILEEAL